MQRQMTTTAIQCEGTVGACCLQAASSFLTEGGMRLGRTGQQTVHAQLKVRTDAGTVQACRHLGPAGQGRNG